ncbi:MAG: DinB family protein [Actinobacteria bacterium]|nr:DinB family protein [Actinomycetota bacterium]
MDIDGLLLDAFSRITEVVHDAVEGLGVDALVWRPEPQANPIGWLVWHLTRIQDDHVSEIAGQEQTWTERDWATSFGLPAGAMDHGWGHTSEQVAAVRPASAAVLLEYHDRVSERTVAVVASLRPDDLDRIIDDNYEPPVSVGVRLVSVVDDGMQHAGQAAYVRGMIDRLA